MNRRPCTPLDCVLWFLLASLIFLWFKGNFSFLDGIRISPLVPLFLFTVGLCIKLLRGHRKKKKQKTNVARFLKKHLVVVVLLLLATGLRIPFLSHSYGLMTSDHAVPALMGKHISEGHLPPIYYYGQFYMGSLSGHFYALVFFLFGYSIFALKLATLLFFLAFIAVQYALLNEIFGSSFSLAVCLFYCLPIGHLVSVSFDNTSAYPLVLLLGSLLLYSSYEVAYKDRSSLVPFMGFLMGLSFWTHQICIAFIVTALCFLALKFRWQIKKYLVLCVFAVIGCLPVLLFEILEGFPLVRFLSPDGSKILLLERAKRVVQFILPLFSLKETPLNYFFLCLIALGLGLPVYLAFKKKKMPPQCLFPIFFAVFLFMYVFSDFADVGVVRYLYPFYFCLPVLLLSFVLVLKVKIRVVFAAGLVFFLFFFNNFEQQVQAFRSNQDTDRHLRQVVEKMEETGEKYWRGEYWTAYLLSALSGENVVVDSYTKNRYFPYKLECSNRSEHDNYVFLRNRGVEANMLQRLIGLLDGVGLGYRKMEIGESNLVFDAEGTVFPAVLTSSPPPCFPDYTLKEVNRSGGYLTLIFQNNRPVPDLHLRAQVKIPTFSSAARAVSWEREEFGVEIPFPDQKLFQIRYHFEYNGLRFPSSEKVLSYSIRENEWGKRMETDVVRLDGFGPAVSLGGKKRFLCQKEASLEVNKKLWESDGIKLYLYSPFGFSHPFWYGDYAQRVSVTIDGYEVADEELEDGENCIDIRIDNIERSKKANVVRLKFKYHLPFEFAPRWKTAALFDRIEIQ